MKKIAIFVAMALMAVGCGGAKEQELGPGETVQAFCKAVAENDLAAAEGLCDMQTMKEYMDSISEIWNSADSSVTDIAPAILSEMQVKIDDITKKENGRTVFYTISLPEGKNKEKIADLRKEEKGWKIERITDRH